MLGQDRDVGQDADAEPGRHRGLDAEHARARIGHVPGPPGHLHRMDHAIAIKAALLGHDQRQRIAVEVDRMLAARHPLQALGPGRDAAALAGVALVERKVELATLDRAARLHAQSAAHVEP